MCQSEHVMELHSDNVTEEKKSDISIDSALQPGCVKTPTHSKKSDRNSQEKPEKHFLISAMSSGEFSLSTILFVSSTIAQPCVFSNLHMIWVQIWGVEILPNPSK